MAADFDHATREDRQQALEKYGAVMHRMFCGLIALHRLERTINKVVLARTNSDPYAEERVAKAQSQKKALLETVSNAWKALDKTDQARCKMFSAELMHRDLSSNDDVIIEDVLRRLRS